MAKRAKTPGIPWNEEYRDNLAWLHPEWDVTNLCEICNGYYVVLPEWDNDAHPWCMETPEYAKLKTAERRAAKKANATLPML